MVSNGLILAEVKELKAAVQEFKRMVDVQSVLIHGLRQDNRDMLNRLMVRSMSEYAATSPASVAEMNELPAERLARDDEFGREHFAGEIVDEA
jgi:hypothetical protein